MFVLEAGGGGVELGVADCDDTIETGCGFFRPGGGWTRGGRFEVWQYGGEGGVVVAFLGVNGLKIGGQEERGRVEEAVPVKASSGRTVGQCFAEMLLARGHSRGRCSQGACLAQG